jgi:antibiotic biosynthesis monooxygenase (ABM) superfamily enzyme
MRNRILFACLGVILASSLFLAGYVTAQSQVNTPSTIIHHVSLKWKAGATDADKERVFTELKSILSEVPGAKNLWTKTVKAQPRDFSQTFVIEFENQAALDAYANHPRKQAWNDMYYGIREESRNNVTTN